MVDIRKIDAFFNGERPFSEKNSIKLNARSKFLRMAKLAMPSLAAVIIGCIMVFPSLKKETILTNTDITMPKKGELEKLHVEKTVFSITNKENKVSNFTADSLDETEEGSKLIKIVNPKGKLPTQKNNEVVNLESKTGYYNQTDKIIEVKDDVKAVYTDGTVILTQSAFYEFDNSFGYGKEDIHAYGTWGKLWSQGFEFYQQNELLVLLGDSKVIHDVYELTSCDTIKYFHADNRIEAFGNVKMITQNNTLYADKVFADLVSDDKFKIKKVEAFGNVIIVTKDGVAKGDYALYNPDIDQVELLGNVSIKKDGNIIYGQKAITNLKTSISKILSSVDTTKRVSGVIKGSTVKEKNNEKK